MELTFFDIAFFVIFFGIVVGVSVYKSRHEETGEDFFLAGRGLIWPLIGLSLIAANISTEQFVGMAGQGAGIAGMAVASYEWLSAIGLVVVAIVFLPKFLKSGIFTIPEYLEYRYNSTARGLMAFYTMFIYVGVTISAVIYTGGLNLNTLFDLDIVFVIWLIGGIAALYTIWGGLKAVAWADLFLGSALIIGGAITLYLGLDAVGGLDSFLKTNQDKLHMILPSDHSVLPWTTLVFGLWIPVFYYWGLNQYIMQRTLAARSLKHGQFGILFAAFLKLIIPFIIIFPGIIAFQLYKTQLTGEGSTTDAAYPLLIRNLVSPGVRGFIFAAISGAVISSLASMLNSASTVFSIDIYKRYWKKDVSDHKLVTVGRIATAVFVIVGCLIAPQLANPKFKGIFNYIQEFQGFLSPGVLAAFVFGIIFKKAPPKAGVAALILSPILYLFLYLVFGHIAFLNRMGITFVIIIIVMAVITIIEPLQKPVEMPVKQQLDLKLTPSVKYLSVGIVLATLILYILFW
jgi:SSS family solute:Na+ symporter